MRTEKVWCPTLQPFASLSHAPPSWVPQEQVGDDNEIATPSGRAGAQATLGHICNACLVAALPWLRPAWLQDSSSASCRSQSLSLVLTHHTALRHRFGPGSDCLRRFVGRGCRGQLADQESHVYQRAEIIDKEMSQQTNQQPVRCTPKHSHRQPQTHTHLESGVSYNLNMQYLDVHTGP